jgi:hypothetical protein
MENQEFKDWWRENYTEFPSTEFLEQCFYAGFDCAMFYVWRVVKIVFFVAVLGLGVTFLSGCEERYRYFCQNPDNFHKEQCQKPRCQFTQQCPEYLVAPILEKQIESTKQASEPAAKR